MLISSWWRGVDWQALDRLAKFPVYLTSRSTDPALLKEFTELLTHFYG